MALQSHDFPEQRLFAAYYDVEDFQGTLILNNKGPRRLDVELTLWSLEGERFHPPIHSVPGNTVVRLDMDELVSVAGALFLTGRLEAAYRGKILEMGAQIMLEDRPGSLILSEQLVHPEKEFVSSRLEGLWWMPRAQSEFRLALANRSDRELDVHIGVDDFLASRRGPLTLKPDETRVISLKALRRGGWPQMGGVGLRHDGQPGDLLARGIILDRGLRFSYQVDFLDPANAATSICEAAGLRLGSFQGEPLLPILGLRNIGQRPTTARVRISLTDAEGNPHFVELPEAKLRPGGTVDLSDTALESLNALGIDLEGSTAGVEVAYDSSPGRVIAAVAGISANFDHVFQVPALDPGTVQASAGGLPWSLAEGRSTRLIFKNVTDSEQRFKYQIGFETGVYTAGLQALAPSQTLAIDVRQLREDQIPDLYGATIPLDAQEGQALWSAYRLRHSPENARIPILARAEAIDFRRGLASSYSCSNCCQDSFHSGFLSPSSLIGLPGGQEDVSAMERSVNCYGTILNPFPVPANWSISNTTVATISSGITVSTVSCLAPGLAQMTAEWGAPMYHESGLFCEYEELPVEECGEVEVPSPSMSCTSSVNRGQTASCTISDAGTSTISNWKFAATGVSVTRSSGQSEESWSGVMVQSGTVSVTVGTESLSDTITVNARTNFKFMAVAPVEKDDGFNTVLTLTSPPGISHDLGISHVKLKWSFNDGIVDDGGPNQGFRYVTSITSSPTGNLTKYLFAVNADLVDTESEFFLAQCGNYNPQTGTGFIGGSQLTTNARHHEGGSPANSHYSQYKAAQDDNSNNVGLGAESKIGAPGISQSEFRTQVGQVLTTRAKAIIASGGVEPCEDGDPGKDGNCIFKGPVNLKINGEYAPCI